MLLYRDASSTYRKISSVKKRTRAKKLVPFQPSVVAGFETYTIFGSLFILPKYSHREKVAGAFIPPSIWNKRGAALKGLKGVARTTNAVEGWHFGIRAFFSGSQPSLWRMLESLKKDSANKYISICSEQQVRRIRGVKSIDNWRRR